MNKSITYYLLLLLACYVDVHQLSSVAAPTEDIMSSICGNNGTTNMLFVNIQELEEHNRILLAQRTASFKLTPLGCCLLENCSYHDMNVCAIDINTNITRVFNNSCIMAQIACKQNIDWRFVGNGQCNQVVAYPIPCTKIYDPVCAIFAGVKSTFASECLVNAENLRAGADWRILSKGICTQDQIHHILRSARSLAENSQKETSFKDTSTWTDSQIIYINENAAYETKILSDHANHLIEGDSNVIYIDGNDGYKSRLLSDEEKYKIMDNYVRNSIMSYRHADERYESKNLNDTEESNSTLGDNNMLNINSNTGYFSKNLHQSTHTGTTLDCPYGNKLCGIRQTGETSTFDNMCEMFRNMKENNSKK